MYVRVAAFVCVSKAEGRSAGLLWQPESLKLKHINQQGDVSRCSGRLNKDYKQVQQH